MEKMIRHERRIVLAALLMSIQCLYFSYFFSFNVKLSIGTAAVEYLLFIVILKELIKQEKKSENGHPYTIFNLISLTILFISLYLIGQASYTEGLSYWKWLIRYENVTDKNIDFEAATNLLAGYLIIVSIHLPLIVKMIKKNVIKWIPSFSCMIIGVGLNIYFKPGFDHFTRITVLVIGSVLLAVYMFYILIRYSSEKISLFIDCNHYLLLFLMMMCFIWGIGFYLPELQELPGTRWIHHVINGFGVRSNLAEWIPYENNINSETPSSEAVLFEVQSAEPLYLRDIAYNEYHDGVWSLSEGSEYDQYISFKPQYLQAEYAQLNTMLDEINWLNSQNGAILPEYKWLSNYEKSVVTERRYKVIQNPINKINYLTVNGFKQIEDKDTDKVYYYHSLNNDYFYSERLVEPSDYQVSYYNHVPKVGSREYLFLHQINGEKWEALYEKLARLREQYDLEYSGKPKLLLTYTQLVQYKNAKYSFTQVPNELKGRLQQYAQTIIGEEESDWGRAQAISEYLKQNYVYTLQSKKTAGDRVLWFLFDAREGICKDFATSMVLMCRSIGVPAKYVTGYLAKEKNSETGNYVVKEKDAHAFVEVYIAGYGWMTFDPTPSEVSVEEEKTVQDIQINDVVNFIGAAFIILVLFIISGTGRRYIKEKWWQIKYLFGSPEEKMNQLLRACFNLLKAKDLAKKKYETLSQYSKRLQEEDIDISVIILIFEKQKYGMLSPDRQDIQAASQCYKQLKRQLKKKK